MLDLFLFSLAALGGLLGVAGAVYAGAIVCEAVADWQEAHHG